MEKVLVVENNDLNLKLFYDLLMTKKCEVVTSKDSVGVTEITSREKSDPILMDIQLNGGISGINLIKALKKNTVTKYIPIITITAFVMKNDIYLSKPFSIDSFFQGN